MNLAMFVGVVLLASAAPAPGHTAQQEIPLAVVDEYYDPVAGTLLFSLANQGEKLITAWGLLITAGDSSGKEEILGFGEDHVKSLYLLPAHAPPPDYEGSLPLKPGDVIAYQRSIPLAGNPVFHVVSVRVTFVIFDDASAVGDRRDIELRYQDRLGQLDATEIFLDLADMSISESWSSEDFLAAIEDAEVLARTEWDEISYEVKTGGGTRHARVFSKAGELKSLLSLIHSNSLRGFLHGLHPDMADGLRATKVVASESRELLRTGIPEDLRPLP